MDGSIAADERLWQIVSESDVTFGDPDRLVTMWYKYCFGTGRLSLHASTKRRDNDELNHQYSALK